jgi:hypothetical protein
MIRCQRFTLLALLAICIVELLAPCEALIVAKPCFRRNKCRHDFQHPSSRSRSSSRDTTTRLFLQQNNATQEEEPGFFNDWSSRSRIEDKGLLVADLVAIVIASQLMGLLDVLNDPDFVRNGGWLQPIRAVPSTLNVLVERISTLSLVWIVAALLGRKDSFSSDGVSDDVATVQKALGMVLNFGALRLLVAFAVAAATQGGDLDYFGEVLRECYFVGLAIPGFRFLYGQYFR